MGSTCSPKEGNTSYVGRTNGIQNHVASGTCDRHVNPADGVGSLTNGPRTHPAHAEGVGCIKVPNRVG